jgi:hypothetical protein
LYRLQAFCASVSEIQPLLNNVKNNVPEFMPKWPNAAPERRGILPTIPLTILAFQCVPGQCQLEIAIALWAMANRHVGFLLPVPENSNSAH